MNTYIKIIKNNLIIITIIIVGNIIFSSCERKYYYNTNVIKTIDNRTNKDLYYEVETKAKYYNVYAVYVEQKSVNSIFVYDDGYYTYPKQKSKPQIEVYRERIYNLTDTTKFEHWKYDTSISEAGRMFRDVLFSINSSTNNTYIKVTDDFLQLLPKDYSMLEKFPEYYKK